MLTNRTRNKSAERSSVKQRTVVTVTKEVHTVLYTSSQPQKTQVKSSLSAKDKKKSVSSGSLWPFSTKKKMDNKTYTDKANTALSTMNQVFYPPKPLNYQPISNKNSKINIDMKNFLSGSVSSSSYTSPYSGKRIDYVQPRPTKVTSPIAFKPKQVTTLSTPSSPAYQSSLITSKKNQIPFSSSFSSTKTAYPPPNTQRMRIYPSAPAPQTPKPSSFAHSNLNNPPPTSTVLTKPKRSPPPPPPPPKTVPYYQYPKIRTVTLPEINKHKLNTTKTPPRQPGVAYIFNHEIFDNPENEKREGSKEDVKMLDKTFSHFNLDVKIYTNLTVNGIKAAVTKIEQKNFSRNSCLVITILSHGNRLERIAAKDGSYSIDDDVLFPILRNKTLESKPKIFIIQACKGDVDLRDYKTDSAKPGGNPSEVMKCYSTFEGYVSYRSVRGSVFVQTLCELLQQYGAKKDFMEIMQMCIREVKSRTKDLQIPTLSTTITMPYVFGDYK